MTFDTERSKVAHLLRRAGFGYTPAELDRATSLGFDAVLNWLLRPELADDSATNTATPSMSVDPNDKEARKRVEPVKFQWVSRMLTTRRPLQEKMTLFWHTHFATASSKVADAFLMQQQIALFRANGLAGFEPLLQKATRDPAMLVWLDNTQNRKGSPNENYAREVMELFTLGIGNYSESDIHAAAKAFTGYGIDANRQFVFTAKQHDTSQKNFMGVTQNWDADDIIAALVRHPAHAPFLMTKLFNFFVHDHPSAETIARLSGVYQMNNFDIRLVLVDLFKGPEFLSADAYHGRIKSPVELVTGTIRALEVGNVGPDVTQSLRRMGQDLLNPPDVSGWKGGPNWINSTTLFERLNFVNRIVTARPNSKPNFTDTFGQMSTANVVTDQDAISLYSDLLLDNDLAPEARRMLADYVNTGAPFSLDPAVVDVKGRGLVHLTASVPTYQLA